MLDLRTVNLLANCVQHRKVIMIVRLIAFREAKTMRQPTKTLRGVTQASLRRLGFESMAWGEEVLVREGLPAYEPQMEGPADQKGLRPFPVINPTIQIRRDSYSNDYSDLSYLDEFEDEDEDIGEDEIEHDEDLHYE